MSDIKIKQQLRVELWPILELLEFKKNKLSTDDWIKFVDMTKLRIVSNPSQFFGGELPDRSIIQTTIDEIFLEYLSDEIPA